MRPESRCTSPGLVISSTDRHHATPGTIALAVVSGSIISLQSRANGQLSHELGNAIETACVSFGSGFLFLILMALASRPMRDAVRRIPATARARRLPRWHTIGGMLGAIFVIVQAYSVPLVGVALFSVATIGGQTAASMIVDRIGLRAGITHHITAQRAITGLITVIAVGVSVSDRITMPSSSLLAPVLGLLVGGGVSVQRALNAHVNDYAQHSFATTWWNFMMGCILLFTALFITALGGQEIVALPRHNWWMYTGGAVGVVYIAIANVVAQRISVLLLTALSVGGQLASSLLLDLLAPTPGIELGPHIYAGVALSLLGILVGVARRPVRATVGPDDEEL